MLIVGQKHSNPIKMCTHKYTSHFSINTKLHTNNNKRTLSNTHRNGQFSLSVIVVDSSSLLAVVCHTLCVHVISFTSFGFVHLLTFYKTMCLRTWMIEHSRTRTHYYCQAMQMFYIIINIFKPFIDGSWFIFMLFNCQHTHRKKWWWWLSLLLLL